MMYWSQASRSPLVAHFMEWFWYVSKQSNISTGSFSEVVCEIAKSLCFGLLQTVCISDWPSIIVIMRYPTFHYSNQVWFTVTGKEFSASISNKNQWHAFFFKLLSRRASLLTKRLSKYSWRAFILWCLQSHFLSSYIEERDPFCSIESWNQIMHQSVLSKSFIWSLPHTRDLSNTANISSGATTPTLVRFINSGSLFDALTWSGSSIIFLKSCSSPFRHAGFGSLASHIMVLSSLKKIKYLIWIHCENMYWSIILSWHCQSFQSILKKEIMEGDWDLFRTPQKFRCWHSIRSLRKLWYHIHK